MIKINGYISIKEYAEKSFISISLARKLSKQKKIKSVKKKGRVYVWIG